MICTQKEIYDKLYQIFVKFKQRYKNPPKSEQLCCMWSVNNPPDIIEGTAPIIDIEDAFNIEISEEDCLELYDMNLDQACEKIVCLINLQC